MIRRFTPLPAFLRAATVVVALAGGALAAGDADRPTVGLGDAVGVGVAPFEHEGYGADGITATARGLVEQELSRHARVALIERSRLADLLEEISFQQSGITTPDGAAEVGVGHNVQFLVFGQAARRAPQEYRLALRVVDVATGRVLRSEETAVPREGPAFERVVRALAKRLISLALAGLPADDILGPPAPSRWGPQDIRRKAPCTKCSSAPSASIGPRSAAALSSPGLSRTVVPPFSLTSLTCRQRRSAARRLRLLRMGWQAPAHRGRMGACCPGYRPPFRQRRRMGGRLVRSRLLRPEPGGESTGA